MGSSSMCHTSHSLDGSVGRIHKVTRKILCSYPYKISHIQQLFNHDQNARETSALQFLAQIEVNNLWPWNILWIDKAHFHLHGAVNMHNCRIWANATTHVVQEVPLHSPRVTIRCSFTTEFIIGPFFFKEPWSCGSYYLHY